VIRIIRAGARVETRHGEAIQAPANENGRSRLGQQPFCSTRTMRPFSISTLPFPYTVRDRTRIPLVDVRPADASDRKCTFVLMLLDLGILRIRWQNCADKFRSRLEHASPRLALQREAAGPRTGFTLIAALKLALGIGANTAIFSTVNALLLRPYPFPNLDRLMLLRESDPNHPGEDRTAPADYLDIRSQGKAFSDIAAFRFGDFSLGNESGTGAVEGYLVTPNLFQMIGARPLLGRNLSSDDGEEGSNLVAVISHNTWRERFASDQSIVGKTVRLNGRNTDIVGVMPAGFHYPLGAEIWMPLTLTPAERADRSSRNLFLLATLNEGVSRKQAEAELLAFSSQLQRQYPTSNGRRSATLLPLREEQYTYTAPMFLMLQAAAGFVLLLACANLLNLLLAQAVSRRHEIAVRSSLGANRLRLARLFAGETMLLALLAVSVAVSVSFG